MLGGLFDAACRHVLILVTTLAFIQLTRPKHRWLPWSPPSEPWELDYASVVEARKILVHLRLPMELALQVLEHAEYWPARSFASRATGTRVAATMMRSSAAGLCVDADVFNADAVQSLRQPGEQLRVKAVSFRIRSRDQGWTSEPTRGSFSTSSWLEVSILRGVDGPNTELPPSCYVDSLFENPSSFAARVAPLGWRLVARPEDAEQGPQGGEGALAWYLQGNRVATGGKVEGYVVRWTREGCEGNEGCGSGEGFLEELREGDRVLVWARAKVSWFFSLHLLRWGGRVLLTCGSGLDGSVWLMVWMWRLSTASREGSSHSYRSVERQDLLGLAVLVRLQAR